MEQELFIKQVFSYAKTKGFDAFELYFESGKSLGLTSFESDIINYSDNEFKGVNFRGVINGKAGSAFSEVLNEEAAVYIVDKAHESALLIENDDRVQLINEKLAYQPLALYNDALELINNKDKIDFVINLDKEISSHPKIDKVSGAYTGNASLVCRLVNSHGIDIGYKRNNAYGAITVVAKDGDESYTGYAVKAHNDFKQIINQNIGQKAIQKVMEKMGAKPVKSGKYKVLLAPEASSDLLSVFMAAFSAEMAQKGLSLLKDKTGQIIAASSVTLVDDPHLHDGLASCPFDGEGIPTFKKSLIEDGVFITFLHNMNTAYKEGVKTTANAYRSSFKSKVGIAHSNAYFKPSNIAVSNLYQQVGNGLIITELDGLHAGANSITGDFSLSCRGFVLSSGKQREAFRGVVVSGNYFEVLKNIIAVGNDLTFDNSSIGSPTLYIKELKIAGV